MNNNRSFQKHKKSDAIKWIIAFVCIALLAIAITAVCTRGFKAIGNDKAITSYSVLEDGKTYSGLEFNTLLDVNYDSLTDGIKATEADGVNTYVIVDGATAEDDDVITVVEYEKNDVVIRALMVAGQTVHMEGLGWDLAECHAVEQAMIDAGIEFGEVENADVLSNYIGGIEMPEASDVQA